MKIQKCRTCGKKIEKKAEKCSNCGALIPKKSSFIPWIIAIVVIGYVLVQFSDDIKKFLTNNQNDMILNFVNVEISWVDSGSDKVMKADLHIINNSQYDIKNIEITCIHYDFNGSRVSGKELTIYEVVSSNGQKDINYFTMGFKHPEIEQTECEVTDLDVI